MQTHAILLKRLLIMSCRTTRDSLEVKNISGFLVSIDFEKAYDSVAHYFTIQSLRKFNSGSYFMQWIRTF